MNFSSSASSLQLRNSSFRAWRQHFLLRAAVTEAVTNITVRGSEFGGKLERTPFSLESRTPRIFSIGLPFYGEVVARSFDGSARSDLEVSVRVITSWRELGSSWGFEEKFRADSGGRVAFAIPPFPRGRRHVAVFVTVAKPNLNVTNAPGQLFLSNPSLYLFLTEVFSMLDVGLQVRPCRRGEGPKMSYRSSRRKNK